MNSHTRVTGKFLVPVGSEEKPLSGEVSFIAMADSIRGDGKIYLPAPVTVQLDEAGAFAVDLLVPTDGLQPSAWTWEAVPSLSYEGAMVPWCSFFFDPAGKSEVDLSEVAPVPDPVTGEYMTRGEPGPAPELSIGEVVTVGPGEEAVTVTGPAEAPVLDFALPRGRLGWTGDKGDPGEPGPPGAPGEKGEPGASVASVTGAGDALVLGMTDGSSHRVPIPVGLIGQGAAGGVTDLGDGTGRATGALAWSDSGDGTGVVSPAPGSRLSFAATAHELPAGESPTVDVSGVFPDFELAVGVPAGAAGPAGPKGEPGNPAALVLVGAGRPDVPSTLSPENQTAVANALVGATFTSIDGAGTGAWAWVKTPGGWHLTYGDTGWRNIGRTAGFTADVLIRRVDGVVYLAPRADAWKVEAGANNSILSLPAGFRSSVRAGILLTAGVSIIGRILAKPGGGELYVTTVGNGAYSDACGASYATADPWPATLPGSPA